MKSDAKITFDRLPTTFSGLIEVHSPRPIHDETGYNNTVEVIDAMAGHSLNEDQDDYILLLSTLVERYEAESLSKRTDITGLDLLRYLLDENRLSGDDLARIIGVDRSVAYRILKGERGLTTGHISALCERFGISADALIRGDEDRLASAKYSEAAHVAVEPVVREAPSNPPKRRRSIRRGP